MKLAVSLFAFLLSTVTFSGTKSTLSDFAKVRVGMAKTEVLAEVHSPHTSRRWKGQDRWEYHFYEKKGDIVVTIKKEVLFKEGVVTYAGEPLTPKVSAEEQDKINLAADLKALEDWEAHKQKAVDAREEYKEWVRDAKNDDPDPDVRLPKFEKIK